MQTAIASPLLFCTLLATAVAQEQPSLPVKEAPAPPPSARPTLSAGEEKIRTGIMLLAGLHDILARVQDKESAEAAVAPIMRFIGQLQAWGVSFNSLPPLNDETRELYEQRYLPIVEQLNKRIQAQADRLASAEFYGSRNLPAALVKLVTNFQ